MLINAPAYPHLVARDEPFTALKNDHPYYKALIVVPPQNIVKDSLIENYTAGKPLILRYFRQYDSTTKSPLKE